MKCMRNTLSFDPSGLIYKLGKYYTILPEFVNEHTNIESSYSLAW